MLSLSLSLATVTSCRERFRGHAEDNVVHVETYGTWVRHGHVIRGVSSRGRLVPGQLVEQSPPVLEPLLKQAVVSGLTEQPNRDEKRVPSAAVCSVHRTTYAVSKRGAGTSRVRGVTMGE